MKGKQISDLVTAMSNGSTYVNVHTEKHPNGEIRGQVMMEKSTNDTMSLGVENEPSSMMMNATLAYEPDLMK